MTTGQCVCFFDMDVWRCGSTILYWGMEKRRLTVETDTVQWSSDPQPNTVAQAFKSKLLMPEQPNQGLRELQMDPSCYSFRCSPLLIVLASAAMANPLTNNSTEGGRSHFLPWFVAVVAAFLCIPFGLTTHRAAALSIPSICDKAKRENNQHSVIQIRKCECKFSQLSKDFDTLCCFSKYWPCVCLSLAQPDNPHFTR